MPSAARSLGKTPHVLAGAAASGCGNYLFQVIATRALGDEAFAPLGVLWTIWYLLLTIFLYAVEAWMIRVGTTGSPDAGVRSLAVAVVLVALVLGAGTWALAGPLFAGLRSLSAVTAMLVLTYGAFALVRGQLAGANRFGPYAVLTALESIAKVALAVPVVLYAASPIALAAVMPTGPVIALGWWWLRYRKRTLAPLRRKPAIGAGLRPGRFLLIAAVPGAAAQVLLAAGPLMLVALAAPPVEVSVFFVTITAARVPIVLVFGGLLSLVLPPLTGMAKAGELRKLRRISVLTAGGALMLGAIGAAVGAYVGPSLVALLFGVDFRPPGWLAALTAYGVIVASGGMLVNQVLVAWGRELALIPPWLVGLVAAGAAITLVAGTPSWRVAIGFAIGVTFALFGLVGVVVAGAERRPAAGDVGADGLPVIGEPPAR